MASAPDGRGKFTILYFASAGTFTKKASETMDAPKSLSSLFPALEEQYPGIRAKVLDSAAVTINLQYMDLERMEAITINADDEVAIIPPVSSG